MRTEVVAQEATCLMIEGGKKATDPAERLPASIQVIKACSHIRVDSPWWRC